ncbi:hypothetical protein [Phyllobacterium sp. SB3]|uniref:hypothetical protein n=1 Tax=Phyllobacterium sp. SB3 TaxID=3156073 RepID=UPI0032B004A7
MITDLEYAILRKYCEQEGKRLPLPDTIKVISRDRNPVGFITTIMVANAAVDWDWNERVYQHIPEALPLGSDDTLGFLLCFEGKATVSIEGYVNGEDWPDPEFPIEFTSFATYNVH